MNGACNVKKFFGPAPWGPGEGSKGQISFNSNYKVNFKDFCTKLCACSHKWKIQNISEGFWFCRLGHAPGVGLWGTGGAKSKKKNFQTWSCGISNQRGWPAEQNASKIFILRSNWWPWGEVNRSNIIEFRLTCQFQRFLYQTLCVLYKWKIQNISDRIFILSLWSCPRGETLGRWSKKIFFKHGHVAYQIDGGEAEQTASKIFILGSNWWPLGEVKRSNIIKFRLPCQFQFFYQTLLVFSQIIGNMLNRIFILLPGSCPRGGTWGCWGVKNLSVGICDGAQSTAHSSLCLPSQQQATSSDVFVGSE